MLNYYTRWYPEGIGESEFKIPEGIPVDSSGSVYVVDSEKKEIYVI